MLRTILSFLLVLALASCAKPAQESAQPESFCRQQMFEGSRFTVCDNRGGELRLIAAGRSEAPLRSFAEVGKRIDGESVAFAMNAGMFDEAGRPIGLARANGKQVQKINLRDGPGNFHMKPNGVFMVGCDGSPAVVASESVAKLRCAPPLATQSGPLLVIDGRLHPEFEHDGTSRLVRNGVGVKPGGKALFVISLEPVSFGKFARFFKDGLNVPNALFFDGSVSSLWDPANGRMDSHSDLGPIIVALKPAEQAPGREGPATP